ncbi:hypothetical protein SDC9_137484 [bioreactor metagenome]|uniref:Uncharacterized protein n=1 Tax=bioreactor metagenome TaxID=1076179 RepID=A0A645DNJ7_9ZZZZ
MLNHVRQKHQVRNVPKETVHLHDGGERKPNGFEPLAEHVERAVHLVFDRLAFVFHAVADEHEISCLDNAGVRPFLVLFQAFDFHIGSPKRRFDDCNIACHHSFCKKRNSI